MYRNMLLIVVALLTLSLVLCSCAKKPDADAALDPMLEPPIDMPADDTVSPPAEEPEEVAEAPDADAVVDQVGAPLYEGAEADTVEIADGKTVAKFYTTASYADVKAYYLEQLQAPDWSNNGFEMGAMGGDEWEFKSADESKLVLVKRASGADKTEVRFTVKAADEH